MTKFITPVSMQVTQTQFEKDLKGPLLRMGYKINDTDFDKYPILVSNLDEKEGSIGYAIEERKDSAGRTFIDHYNPELFLVLAAMTDEKCGIAGEWWTKSGEFGEGFTAGRLYRAGGSIDRLGVFKGDNGATNGFYPNNLKYFRKATKEELIAHFTKEQPVVANAKEGYRAEFFKNVLCGVLSAGLFDPLPLKKKPLKIEPGKLYRTRDGRKARIYATDAGGDYPVHGATLESDIEQPYWDAHSWTAEGRLIDTPGKEDADIVAEWIEPVDFDWGCLPAWADKYIAKDPNGEWFSYADKPELSKEGHTTDGEFVGIPAEFHPKGDFPDWRNTLHKNPKYQD
jgi:hypothetical protein